MAFLYILQNAAGMTFVGVSKHPLNRLKEHNSAAHSLRRHYTNRNRPWTIAAVFTGFATRAQALRAEYTVKHRPQKVPHRIPIVSRISTAQSTCEYILRTDPNFHSVKALAVVVWDQDVHLALQALGVAGGDVTILYVG
jgi:predicted GIY-YIG superfamily endonuclease